MCKGLSESELLAMKNVPLHQSFKWLMTFPENLSKGCTGYPAGYPALFDIRYPAGYPIGRIAGYPAGYPARKTVLN